MLYSAEVEGLYEIIRGYENTDAFGMTPDDVQKWVNQFPEGIRKIMLEEMIHIFSKWYFTEKDMVKKCRHWIKIIKKEGYELKDMGFIPGIKGQSIEKIKALFLNELRVKCGIEEGDMAEDPTVYLFLDDFLISGNTFFRTIEAFCQNPPASCKTILSCTVLRYDYHNTPEVGSTHAYWYGEAKKVCSKYGIKMKRAGKRMESRKDETLSYVLYPTMPEDNREAVACVKEMQEEKSASWSWSAPRFRARYADMEDPLFTSVGRRKIVEDAFLLEGLRLKDSFANVAQSMRRPMGYEYLASPGGGCMCASYSNIPNNCPLALWMDTSNWNPLLRRRGNELCKDIKKASVR